METVVDEWYRLPSEVMSAYKLGSFKYRLDKYVGVSSSCLEWWVSRPSAFIFTFLFMAPFDFFFVFVCHANGE